MDGPPCSLPGPRRVGKAISTIFTCRTTSAATQARDPSPVPGACSARVPGERSRLSEGDDRLHSFCVVLSHPLPHPIPHPSLSPALLRSPHSESSSSPAHRTHYHYPRPTGPGPACARVDNTGGSGPDRTGTTSARVRARTSCSCCSAGAGTVLPFARPPSHARCAGGSRSGSCPR